MNYFHKGVLVKEAINFLEVKPGRLYIDATVGGGGHTLEIIKQGGRVLAIDRDPEAIRYIRNRVKESRQRPASTSRRRGERGSPKAAKNQGIEVGKDLILANENYSHIYEIARQFGYSKVSGIVFDLGMSSYQLEDEKRGFSFLKNGPLDMRMDENITLTAFDIINFFERRRLNEIFQNFGQEKLSWPISEAICSARKVKPIKTTWELAQIICEVYQKYRVRSKLNPATKVFQSLRIVVNSELLNLKETLPQTISLLEKKGRLVIISFHSLEDAIVKRFFKEEKELLALTKLPIGPGAKEILKNPRSRSAKLRAAEKIRN